MREEGEGGGAMANMPTQASRPVMEVGSGGGVMSGCGDPFWETVEQGGLQNLQLLVGWVELQLSYPPQKAGRYTIMHGNAVAHVQFTLQTVGSWKRTLLGTDIVRLFAR